MKTETKVKKINQLHEELTNLYKEQEEVECPWASKSEKKIEKIQIKIDNRMSKIAEIAKTMTEEEFDGNQLCNLGYLWDELQEVA